MAKYLDIKSLAKEIYNNYENMLSLNSNQSKTSFSSLVSVFSLALLVMQNEKKKSQIIDSNANKVAVFSSFLYNLGINSLKKINQTNNINVSILTKKLSSFPESDFSIFNDISLTYKNLQEKNIVTNTNLTLKDIAINSVNKDTEKLPDNTIQELRNIPVKEIIFSGEYKNTNAKNCKVYKDLEYEDGLKYEQISNQPSETNKSKKEKYRYFQNEYNFSNDYDKSEYDSLNVTLDYLLESRICVNAANFFVSNSTYTDMNKTPVNLFPNGCCYGIILSYTDDSYKDGKMIPMIYYEFANPIYTNNNTLEIEFNQNGIFKVE